MGKELYILWMMALCTTAMKGLILRRIIVVRNLGWVVLVGSFFIMMDQVCHKARMTMEQIRNFRCHIELTVCNYWTRLRILRWLCSKTSSMTLGILSYSYYKFVVCFLSVCSFIYLLRNEHSTSDPSSTYALNDSISREDPTSLWGCESTKFSSQEPSVWFSHKDGHKWGSLPRISSIKRWVPCYSIPQQWIIKFPQNSSNSVNSEHSSFTYPSSISGIINMCLLSKSCVYGWIVLFFYWAHQCEFQMCVVAGIWVRSVSPFLKVWFLFITV